MEPQILIPILAATLALLIALIYLIFNQRKKCIEWLKYAVLEAEKQLGGGTGQLKLRRVYDWYCSKFPFISSIVSFQLFSKWVDKALTTMKEWLKQNANVAAYVEGDH